MGKTAGPAEIAAALYTAGFRGDALIRQTAIDLAESSGNLNAHNTGTAARPEDSRGLGQINVLAHPEWATVDLFNPWFNAAAQWQVSSGGTDLSPWTMWNNGTAQAIVPSITPIVQNVEAQLNKGADAGSWWEGFPVVGGVVNIATGAGETTHNAADAVASKAMAVPDFLGRVGGIIFDKRNWWRLLLVGVGGSLIVVGVGIYVQQNPEVRRLEADAGKAAAV